jgi:hypothetical protein
MKSPIKAALLSLTLTVSLTVSSPGLLLAQSSQPVKTVNDIAANGSKAYYSFDKQTIVTGTDTAGVGWDIALQRTQLWVNSGTSGKGTSMALLLNNTGFDKVATAPIDGYLADTEKTKAIPPGSGNGWYVYDMNTHTINPAPGRIIIIKTALGKFVKLEILNYYKNGDGDPGYYTFRYAFIDQAQKQ